MDTQESLISDKISILLWRLFFGIFAAGVLFVLAKEWQHHNEEKQLAKLQAPVVAKIRLNHAALRLFTPSGTPEAPSLSADGKQLLYMTRESENTLFDYEIDSVWLAKEQAKGQWRPTLLKPGALPEIGLAQTYFNPTFDANGTHVLTGFAQFQNVLSIPMLPSVKTGLTTFQPGSKQTESIQNLTPESLGIPGEVLQHPKVSPNGEWLTFYTRKKLASRGIYVYHFKTKKLFHISGQDDKHPTWTPDGQAILFHHQQGGDALDKAALPTEQAELGIFKLSFKGNNITWQRMLLDNDTTAYHYFKHPALLPKTPLLFFHGRLKPGGKHLLFVRRLGENTPIYELDISENDTPLKEIKHPATDVQDQKLVFLGKSKKDDTYSFYQLSPEAVQTLLKEVH